MEGFLHYPIGRLIFGGAYIWRGLFFGILRYVRTVSLSFFKIILDKLTLSECFITFLLF